MHRHNLRTAHNNRLDFHSIGHSDAWILEDILQLQVEVYGERVSYLSYQAAGDLELPDFHVGVLSISPDAIISYGLPQKEMLNTLQLVVDGLPEQKMWLAARMGVGVPVRPVHTLPEKLLYFKVQRVLRQKLGGPPTALQVCVEFNRLVGEMYLELVGKAEPVGPNKKLKTPQPDVLSTSRPLATSTPTRCSTTGASTLPTRSSSSCPTRSSSRWRLRTHGTRLSVATPRWHPLCAARFPPTGQQRRANPRLQRWCRRNPFCRRTDRQQGVAPPRLRRLPLLRRRGPRRLGLPPCFRRHHPLVAERRGPYLPCRLHCTSVPCTRLWFVRLWRLPPFTWVVGPGWAFSKALTASVPSCPGSNLRLMGSQGRHLYLHMD